MYNFVYLSINNLCVHYYILLYKSTPIITVITYFNIFVPFLIPKSTVYDISLVSIIHSGFDGNKLNLGLSTTLYMTLSCMFYIYVLRCSIKKKTLCTHVDRT